MADFFQACPNCGTTDPDDFSVIWKGEKITAREAFSFFKIPHEAHAVTKIECDICEYKTARSVTIN